MKSSPLEDYPVDLTLTCVYITPMNNLIKLLKLGGFIVTRGNHVYVMAPEEAWNTIKRTPVTDRKTLDSLLSKGLVRERKEFRRPCNKWWAKVIKKVGLDVGTQGRYYSWASYQAS